jgi:hypothetical protein
MGIGRQLCTSVSSFGSNLDNTAATSARCSFNASFRVWVRVGVGVRVRVRVGARVRVRVRVSISTVQLQRFLYCRDMIYRVNR